MNANSGIVYHPSPAHPLRFSLSPSSKRYTHTRQGWERIRRQSSERFGQLRAVRESISTWACRLASNRGKSRPKRLDRIPKGGHPAGTARGGGPDPRGRAPGPWLLRGPRRRRLSGRAVDRGARVLGPWWLQRPRRRRPSTCAVDRGACVLGPWWPGPAAVRSTAGRARRPWPLRRPGPSGRTVDSGAGAETVAAAKTRARRPYGRQRGVCGDRGRCEDLGPASVRSTAGRVWGGGARRRRVRLTARRVGPWPGRIVLKAGGPSESRPDGLVPPTNYALRGRGQRGRTARIVPERAARPNRGSPRRIVPGWAGPA